VFLVAQGLNDSRLVECGQGAFGRVGLEQQAFVLFGAAGTFDHDRDRVVSVFTPGLEALEPINHLVPAVVRRYDTNGQWSRLVGKRMDGSRS
jgi:hypothetical protein